MRTKNNGGLKEEAPRQKPRVDVHNFVSCLLWAVPNDNPRDIIRLVYGHDKGGPRLRGHVIREQEVKTNELTAFDLVEDVRW